MLPVALAVALFLGVAHPAAADRPHFPLRNSTANATESQASPGVVWTTVTKVVTETAGAGCPANYALNPKPTPTESPTATFVNSVPTATLSPNVHWSYDTKAIENVMPVEPKKGCELYYGASDPSKSGYYAFVTHFFKFPAVNIDHSDHLRAEYHEEKGMTVSFNDKEAFKHALDTWTMNNGLVLIAYISGCGDYAKGERCYFNVTEIEYKHDKLVIVAKGDSTHPDQITVLGETEWGWWNANKERAQAAASDSGDGFSWGTSTTSTTSASPSSPTNASSGSKKPLGQLECTAPADDTHGLPTACLGSNFDQLLDEKLGYAEMRPEAKQFLDSLSSGSNMTGPPTNSTLSTRALRMRRRSLAQRSFWSGVWNFCKQAFTTVYNAVASVINIGGAIDRDISFKVPDPESSNTWAKTLVGDLMQTQSPWGEAILLKSLGSPDAVSDDGVLKYMNVYCVGCGASGHARVAGRARWSPLAGLQEGRLELQANMQFILKLGIDADISLRQKFEYDLFNYGLPALSFGVVTIGPYVSVGARVGLEAAARGKVLVGAEMGMQDSLVVIDLVNPSDNKNSGWDPYFKPVFEASGDVAISAELGLPVGLKCGLKISSWEKAVGVLDEPSIKGTAKVSGSANLTDAGSMVAAFGNSDGCEGILTQISWRNRLWAGLIAAGDAPLLDTEDRGLFRKCIGKDTKQVRRRELGDETLRDAADGSKSLTYNVEGLPTGLYHNALNHKLMPLVNPTGSTRVVSCANGNLYAVQNDNQDNEYCFGLWDTTPASDVVYDGVHRSLHYYNGTMSQLGVSRLRVSDAAEVPRTAVTVALLRFRNPEGDDFYVVADDAEHVLYPIVCDFVDGTESKLFVVNDATTGPETLQRRDLKYSVTGGDVSKCHPLALKP